MKVYLQIVKGNNSQIPLEETVRVGFDKGWSPLSGDGENPR